MEPNSSHLFSNLALFISKAEPFARSCFIDKPKMNGNRLACKTNRHIQKTLAINIADTIFFYPCFNRSKADKNRRLYTKAQ